MDYLDSVFSWLKETYQAGTDDVQEWTQEWQNAVDNFKNKAKTFLSTFDRLKLREKTAQSDPKLKSDYDSLMAKGQWLYGAISNLAQSIDGATKSGLMNGLGLLPLIPLAIIAGTLTAITAWLTNAYIIDRKLDAAEAAIDSGQSGEDLLHAVNKKGSLVNVEMGSMAMWALIGITGFVVYTQWPKLQRLLK